MITEYTFTLPTPAVDLIGKALGKLSWEEANPLIQYLQTVCAEQQRIAAAKEQPIDEPVPEPDEEKVEVANDNDTADSNAG